MCSKVRCHGPSFRGFLQLPAREQLQIQVDHPQGRCRGTGQICFSAAWGLVQGWQQMQGSFLGKGLQDACLSQQRALLTPQDAGLSNTEVYAPMIVTLAALQTKFCIDQIWKEANQGTWSDDNSSKTYILNSINPKSTDALFNPWHTFSTIVSVLA